MKINSQARLQLQPMLMCFTDDDDICELAVFLAPELELDDCA